MVRSQELAKKVAIKYANAAGDKQAAFDPAVIMVFADMIINLIDMFKNCGKTDAQAFATVKNPSLWDRLMLRRLVKQDMTRSEFKSKGKELVDALLSGGKDVTEEEMKELYAEV